MTLDRYYLRRAASGDGAFLREMLYHAIFVPEGRARPPRAVVDQPDLARYVSGWGRQGDEGIVAVSKDSQELIGAAWFRCWNRDSAGYGFVDVNTPELSVAILPGHRGAGLGTQMLERLIEVARGRFSQLSLSCDPANPAWNLYRRLGFRQIGESRVMVVQLPAHDEL